MQPEYILKCEQEPCSPAAAKILKPPAGQKHRWFQHDHLMLVEGTVRKPAAVASPAPDDDARPFAANPSIAAPRRSQRQGHELEGETISVQWVFDDDEELVPATEGSVQTFGDDDAVWYDAVVNKVMKREVEVFYPADDATRRHNLLVSGITAKSPAPYSNYMARGVRWKVKQ